MRFAPHAVSLRQFQYLVAVADRLSFRAAAEQCHVSQPSLSAQVALAEAQLGVQIFERDKRRVLVTAAGREILARARALCIAGDDLFDLARSLGDPLSGTVRIGIIPTVGPYYLPEVAPRLREAFPRLSFLWHEAKTPSLVERLQSAELDAAIVALEAELGDVLHLAIGKDPFVFGASPSHRLAHGRGALNLDALDGEEVLLLDDGHCFRDQALAVCSRAGVAEAGFRATSLQTLVQVAAMGQGVTLLPTLAVGLENRGHPLAVRNIRDAPSRTVVLAYRVGSVLEPTLKALVPTLTKAFDACVPKAGAR
jgi:LysR family hydrogen peroxide-inducible transcriptional activator